MFTVIDVDFDKMEKIANFEVKSFLPVNGVKHHFI